jgi:two-component system NtrC family sensor kinase
MIYWLVLVFFCLILAVALPGAVSRRRARERALRLEQEIAERRLHDYQLAESEKSLRAILAASPVGICRMKGDICQWVNEAMSVITGYDAAELQGKSLRFLYAGDDEYKAAARTLMERDILEAKWIRKDGTPRGVSIRAGRADSDTRVLFVDDVSDAREAEKRQRLGEERFRALFDSAGDAIFVLRDSVVVDCNRRTPTLFGSVKESLLGRSILDLSPSLQPGGRRSRERIEEEIRACLSGGPRVFEWRFHRADGSLFDADVSLSRLDAWGVGFYQAAVRDVTERKRFEHEAILLDNALAAGIEQTAEAVIVTDAGGSIQYVNPAFERITGYSCAEAIGRTPRMLKSGAHDPSFYRRLWETIRGREAWAGRITNRRKDGTLIQEDAVISPFFDSSGGLAGFMALERDATEAARLETRVSHSRKIEMIGQLAGGVAHEFNTILTAIMGYATLLKLKIKGDETYGPYVEQIIGATDKAAGLTRSLLEFGRKQTFDPRPLSLNENVERLRSLLGRLLSEDIELRIEPSNERIVVMADAGRLDQVLVHLVTNARDAMKNGGVLTIRTGRSMIDEKTARENGFDAPGAYGVVSVSDTGTGMDEETREKLFDPFFTTKGVGEGTGVGLSVVYGIVTQHNGAIGVTSEPGRGTAFDVYLPLVEGGTHLAHDSDAHSGDADSDGSSLPRGTETILLAEDNPDLRRLLCMVLREHGYTTIEAEDGSDAVEKALANEIDLVVTDVVMPKMNGWEAYRQITKAKPELPTLFVSGYADNIILRKGVLEEELDFLSKPITPAQLLNKVRSILDRERPAS